jgi:hypothetical protein
MSTVSEGFLLHKVTSFAATMGLLLATVAGLPHSVSAANRNGLWVVVHDICLPAYQGIGVAFPCAEVNIANGLDRGFAVLQTPSSATHVSGSENVPGWVSSKTLVSVTAYHSFGGEVEALNTPTMRRLTPSCRHQLSALALPLVLRDAWCGQQTTRHP